MHYKYDAPSQKPQTSAHWRSLKHEEGDKYLEDEHELIGTFQDTIENGQLAFWSCLFGYCEALTTNKTASCRFDIFPIPFDAINRLVKAEFQPNISEGMSHREAAQFIANWVWASVKSKVVKDELHANSVYTVLRGSVDGKSVDCFGAALATVVGLRQCGFGGSTLTLSEDHAYESHNGGDEVTRCTCEVAIPGNTKSQKEKRAREVAETFDKKSSLTPQTSWLYMTTNPVYCDSDQMILAAALANINPLIESSKKEEHYSVLLMRLKRNLLWVLKDMGHLEKFPFALCELGYAEEHITSKRGDKMVEIEELADVPVTTIEALYHQAIVYNQMYFNNAHVYPYCYMGYFHKDAGQHDEERFASALEYYAKAAKVASRYRYERGDTLQLTKVMTKISEFIVCEILRDPSTAQTRKWQTGNNETAAATWLFRMFDALLAWEESTETRFLHILECSHTTGIKSIGLLSHSARKTSLEQLLGSGDLKSQRLPSLLGEALRKPKVVLTDLHFTISVGTRRRKRKQII